MRFTKAFTVAAVAGLALGALTACSSGSGSRSSGATSSASGATAGFDKATALIGVSLPQRTSENWVVAYNQFSEQLKAAGYKSNVVFSDGGVADQINNITTMLQNPNIKVIVVGAIDGGKLDTVLAQAASKGVKVIAFDRLLTETENVDYYVAFDNFKVGALQGQSLLDGLKAKKPAGPYNIELMAGSPDDNNAKFFFDGAMSVLDPEIKAGNLKVGSGQTAFAQVVTEGWKPENAQRRMSTLLNSYNASNPLDGILSPNDTLARAALAATAGVGLPDPVITGQDSEVESIKLIMQGKQYSTIFKDTIEEVNQTVKTIDSIAAGQDPEMNDTTSYNNGKKVVPAFLLTPVIVTKENAAEAYANNPTMLAATK
ncbi:sugar-binding protein [Micrococcales bacterium 31B]|nr:sugar-binding protein [Micrococcales bacterium 31B]